MSYLRRIGLFIDLESRVSVEDDDAEASIDALEGA
jgi:hypothetical protein